MNQTGASNSQKLASDPIRQLAKMNQPNPQGTRQRRKAQRGSCSPGPSSNHFTTVSVANACTSYSCSWAKTIEPERIRPTCSMIKSGSKAGNSLNRLWAWMVLRGLGLRGIRLFVRILIWTCFFSSATGAFPAASQRMLSRAVCKPAEDGICLRDSIFL